MNETRVASLNYAARLETHLISRLETAEMLAHHFQTQDGFDRETFQVESALFHDMFGDIQALNWVSPTGVIQEVTPLEGNQAALGVDLTSLPIPTVAIQNANESNRLQITPPIKLLQGGTGVAAYIPMTADGKRIGYLNIVLRPIPMIRNALRDITTGDYALKVMDGEQQLFATQFTAGPNAPVGQTTIRVAERDWQLLVSPTPVLIRKMTGTSGILFLVFGAIFAVITGALTQLLIARQRLLQDSQARFQDFASASSDWFWELDENLNVSWMSEGVEAFFELPREKLLGRSVLDLNPYSDTQDAMQRNTQILHARLPFKSLDFKIKIRQDTRWMRISGVPRFDENNIFLGYRGTATNVTDHMRAKMQAAKADQLLANAVEDGRDMFALWDKDDRLVLGNRKFRDLHRDIPDAIAPGTSYETFLRALIRRDYMPEHTAREEAFLAERFAQRANPTNTPIEVMRNDGTILQIRDQRLANGAVVTIAEDVTEQRQNEQALRSSRERYALAVQQVSIWDWDLQANTMYTSPGLAKSLGYTPREFNMLRQSSVEKLVHPDDVDAYIEKLSGHIDDPNKIFSNEHRFRTKSGDYRWFMARGKAIADKNGKAIRSTGVLTDITERVELEEKLNQAQKMEAIGQLTGGVAHDFNNLLTVILGNSELIGEMNKDASLAPMISAINHAITRGAELTQRLLAYSMRQPLRPTQVDIPILIDGLQGLLKPMLGETIALELSENKDLWTALADPGQIEDAVLNLALNARDAMPKGGTITIDCYNRSFDTAPKGKNMTLTAGEYVVIRVTDTGTGMSKSTLKHACEPFFTTKPVGKGSGLGLSMVMGFAQQSGGQVLITSKEGRGTCIKLYLPRALSKPTARPAAQSAGKSKYLVGNGERILLIEDDEALRSLTQQTLHNLGYNVAAAEHAKAAHELITSHSDIKLILSDVVLPGGTSGPAFAAEIQKTQPGMKVVYMSGYPTAVLETDGAFSSKDVLLNKPFKIETLANALHDQLAQAPPEPLQHPDTTNEPPASEQAVNSQTAPTLRQKYN